MTHYKPLILHNPLPQQNENNQNDTTKNSNMEDMLMTLKRNHQLQGSGKANSLQKLLDLWQPYRTWFLVTIIIRNTFWMTRILLTTSAKKCQEKSETVHHHSTCNWLTHRHNHVANVVHQELAIKCGLSKTKPTPYYKY